jgi:hypothetical protein
VTENRPSLPDVCDDFLKDISKKTRTSYLSVDVGLVFGIPLPHVPLTYSRSGEVPVNCHVTGNNDPSRPVVSAHEPSLQLCSIVLSGLVPKRPLRRVISL